MKDFQEVIDTDINDDKISDENYDGEPVKDMTDHAKHIRAAIYHKSDLKRYLTRVIILIKRSVRNYMNY